MHITSNLRECLDAGYHIGGVVEIALVPPKGKRFFQPTEIIDERKCEWGKLYLCVYCHTVFVDY